MEPTDKQLTELWLLCEDYTDGVTVADRMRRAWKFVENSSTQHDAWLGQAHVLCSELGVPPGHIEDRLFEAIGKIMHPNKYNDWDDSVK